MVRLGKLSAGLLKLPLAASALVCAPNQVIDFEQVDSRISVVNVLRPGLVLICLAGLIQAVSAASQPPIPARISPPKLGVYDCRAHHFDSSSGMYEYRHQGSFSLSPKGRYDQQGLNRISKGTWLLDGIRGELRFKGGELDGAVATPIAERPNRFFLAFAGSDSRWTCALK